MQRTVFNEEHEDFRKVIRSFIEAEVVPNFSDWEREGMVPRDFYRQLGKLGVLGMTVPVQYGGAGETSFKFQAALTEETARAAVSFGAFGVHTGLVLPYILTYGTEEQKQRWLPDFISGDMMTAIAMTEPGTGSDLAGIKTTAKRSEDGTHYVLNGAKTFITGGVQADRVLVICRTSPPTAENRRAGLSILAVDTSSEGYEVGRKLEKIGMRTSDTAELSFTDVRVPAEDLLGEEGAAFGYLANNLPQERLMIAVTQTAAAVGAIDFASAYVRDRRCSARRWQSSRTPSSSSPSASPRSRLRSAWSTGLWNCTKRVTSVLPTQPRQNCSAPRPQPRSSTSACSFTGATATCWNTPSRVCTRTPVCRASTAEPTK